MKKYRIQKDQIEWYNIYSIQKRFCFFFWIHVPGTITSSFSGAVEKLKALNEKNLHNSMIRIIEFQKSNR